RSHAAASGRRDQGNYDRHPDHRRRRRAQEMRQLGVVRFFRTYDLLLTPPIACPPFKQGIQGPEMIEGKKAGPFQWIAFTYQFNMTGQPAATVPAGFTKDGLPIGLQIVGRHLDDATVLRAAAAYEV